MTKVIIFRKNTNNKGLAEFLEKKLVQTNWVKSGWEYYFSGSFSGDIFSFTRLGPEFVGKYAKIEPESPNVIKVIGEAPVKLIINLLVGYEGSDVLIEIVQ